VTVIGTVTCWNGGTSLGSTPRAPSHTTMTPDAVVM
jgi:hypothetical protein